MKTTIRKFLTCLINFGAYKLLNNVPRNLQATNYMELLFLEANNRSVIQERPHNFWCSV